MKKFKIILLLFAAVVGGYIISAATSVDGNTTLISKLTVSEKISSGQILNQRIRHTNLNEIVHFQNDTASNTDVDNVYSVQFTSDITIDLTTLQNTLGESMDLTGERIMAIKFKNTATTGTGSVIIDSVTTNGYDLSGSQFRWELKPNQSLLFKADSQLTDVSATNKYIQVQLNSDTLDMLLISADLDN